MPASFVSEFRALPVLALFLCPLHTTRPRALVTHSANALEENSINVNIIAAIRISIHFLCAATTTLANAIPMPPYLDADRDSGVVANLLLTGFEAGRSN
jgi:hypothetical protein